jgi:hypothetical protein
VKNVAALPLVSKPLVLSWASRIGGFCSGGMEGIAACRTLGNVDVSNRALGYYGGCGLDRLPTLFDECSNLFAELDRRSMRPFCQ